MGQRQLISQGVLSYGTCIERTVLSTFALKKVCLWEVSWRDSLLQLLHISMSARHCRPFKVVSELGLYLQWHGGSNWLDAGPCWNLIITEILSFRGILLLLSRSNWQYILLTDDLSIWFWHALCVLFRSVSKVPASEKKERPISTMSEASNYTGGSDYAANPSSPAGRVSDTH